MPAVSACIVYVLYCTSRITAVQQRAPQFSPPPWLSLYPNRIARISSAMCDRVGDPPFLCSRTRRGGALVVVPTNQDESLHIGKLCSL